jgi:hypothetical protein
MSQESAMAALEKTMGAFVAGVAAQGRESVPVQNSGGRLPKDGTNKNAAKALRQWRRFRGT